MPTVGLVVSLEGAVGLVGAEDEGCLLPSQTPSGWLPRSSHWLAFSYLHSLGLHSMLLEVKYFLVCTHAHPHWGPC